jgi:Na+/proline symporter
LQLAPAVLGLAFVRWISRSAILAGLIVGSLFVFFTEPPGLILVEGLFLDLPWGRWPLTVHSAAWGLALNIAAVLLVSIFTRAREERAERDRLHDEFAMQGRVNFGGSAARTAKWSLTLIWAFFALGPGAVLGNTFFSRPFFTQGEAALGIPSLWAWQIFFWLIGVPLVWWLAYGSRLGITADEGMRRVTLGLPSESIGRPRQPAWIAAGLSRVTER